MLGSPTRLSAIDRQTEARGRLKREPAVAGKIYLHPGVGVGIADQILSIRNGFPRRKSFDPAGGNTYRTEHYRHGGGKIITVAFLHFEQKAVNKVLALAYIQVRGGGIRIRIGQILLQPLHLVIHIQAGFCHLQGQFPHTGRK
ncbi:hypothetical protein D3C76_1047010 [compost metagenome]